MTPGISNTLFAASYIFQNIFAHRLTRISAKFGYNHDDVVMLTDDAPNPRQQPTKENIVYLFSRHWQTDLTSILVTRYAVARQWRGTK